MRTTLTAVALVITALTGSGSAHLGKIVYPIYEIPTSDLPDLHDGTLEDWEEALPNASLSQNDFIRDNSGIPGTIDAADLAFRVFLAWHNASQKIYVAVERLDDVYLNEGMQLKIDGDHSGGQYWFFEDEGYSRTECERLWESQAQTYSASPEEDGEDGARLYPGGPERMWMVDDPWADAGAYQIGENPSYSGVEIAVTAGTIWTGMAPRSAGGAFSRPAESSASRSSSAIAMSPCASTAPIPWRCRRTTTRQKTAHGLMMALPRTSSMANSFPATEVTVAALPPLWDRIRGGASRPVSDERTANRHLVSGWEGNRLSLPARWGNRHLADQGFLAATAVKIRYWNKSRFRSRRNYFLCVPEV